MYLERFVNEEEFEAYLNVLKLSTSDCKKEEVSQRLRREIFSAFKFTDSLEISYDLCVGLWVLYALRNDKNEIIGTVAITEDGHCGKTAQIEYVAIREDCQGKGYGRFMLEEINKEIKRHSLFRYSIITTVDEGAFYENCGIKHISVLELDGCQRHFYVQKLRD